MTWVYCISITWVDRNQCSLLYVSTCRYASVLCVSTCILHIYHMSRPLTLRRIVIECVSSCQRHEMADASRLGSWQLGTSRLPPVSRGFYLQTVPHSKARVWSRQFSSLTWPCFFWNYCAYRYCITVIQYNTGDFEYDWHEMQADSASSIWESRPVVLHLQHNTCTSCTASATQDVYCICSTRLLLLHLQQNWLCQMNMKLTLSMIDMRCKLILPLAFEKVF